MWLSIHDLTSAGASPVIVVRTGVLHSFTVWLIVLTSGYLTYLHTSIFMQTRLASPDEFELAILNVCFGVDMCTLLDVSFFVTTDWTVRGSTTPVLSCCRTGLFGCVAVLTFSFGLWLCVPLSLDDESRRWSWRVVTWLLFCFTDAPGFCRALATGNCSTGSVLLTLLLLFRCLSSNRATAARTWPARGIDCKNVGPNMY